MYEDLKKHTLIIEIKYAKDIDPTAVLNQYV